MRPPVRTEEGRGRGLLVRGVSKRFGATQALKSVSLALEPGEIVALCGENGAGKSTLVKLLAGVEQPDEGDLLIAGDAVRLATPRDAQRHGIALVAQELSICPGLSVLDNLWLGAHGVPWLHRRSALRRRAGEVLRLLGFDADMDTPAGELTLGQRQLVEIARGLARDARLLILDEPTATLGAAEIARVFEALHALRRVGRTVLLVTHRLDEVFRLCDRVVVMRNGEKVADAPAARLDRPELVRLMLGRELASLPAPVTVSRGTSARLHARALQLPGVFGPLDVELRSGEVLAVVGTLGAGAAELVRAVAGLEPQVRGSLVLDARPLPLGSPRDAWRRQLMFVSGDRAGEGLFVDLDVQTNLMATSYGRFARAGVLGRRSIARHADRLARAVAVDTRRLRSRTAELSGGNQQKLAFGRCIERGGAGVLAMVEPTRGVDVGARAELHRLMHGLCGQGYSVLLASTDLEEVVQVAHRVITLNRGRVVAEYQAGRFDTARMLADITLGGDVMATGRTP